jgi:LacI family transcriptional regulator/LacI family repressor for deo operon, udp, cdd, tsx, nupC, and nupG
LVSGEKRQESPTGLKSFLTASKEYDILRPILHTCALRAAYFPIANSVGGFVPTTIKDIARVAGVSHTTVSRALNGNRAISAKTSDRIRDLAQQMGYSPNAMARSLLSQHTHTIGLVVTSIADPFVVRIVEAVESVAQKAGYNIFLLATSHNDPVHEVAVVKTLQHRWVDAVIVTASRVGSLYHSELDQIQVPIVLINNQEEGKYLHSVAVDDRQGPLLAIQHLLELGHRRIGYVGTANRPKSSRQRQEGYQTALEQAGLTIDPKLIITPNSKGDFNRGQASLEPLLAAGATAVFCYNDLTAIGLQRACHKKKIALPAQLSVIGYDDIEPTLYVSPQLTTIRQPTFRLGQLAMQMALDLLNNKEVQNQVIACELIVRDSTGSYTGN